MVDDHVSIVMNIDDDVVNAELAQASESDFQQRSSADFNQRFGAVIGQRTQTRTQACSQHHGFHRPRFSSSIFSNSIFSNSMWRSTTSTPSFARRCLASCSARYTERCWPPVQPKEAVRLLKPRLW